jgi:hypothetical protein
VPFVEESLRGYIFRAYGTYPADSVVVRVRHTRGAERYGKRSVGREGDSAQIKWVLIGFVRSEEGFLTEIRSAQLPGNRVNCLVSLIGGS